MREISATSPSADVASVTNASPIFVGGAARSGTTLLRVILDSHPNIACGPELKVTAVVCRMWYDFQSAYFFALREHHLTQEDITRSFRTLLLSFLDKGRAFANKPRVAEKSPGNIFFFPHLHQLFPSSPLIHVIRDGRDVVCSLLGMNWMDPKTKERVNYTRNARMAAEYWVQSVNAGRSSAEQLPSLAMRYTEVRYEHLVTSTEKTLRALFAFLDEPWHEAVLSFNNHIHNFANESSAKQVEDTISTKALARWKTDLAPADKDAVKEVAGPLLMELGYVTDQDW